MSKEQLGEFHQLVVTNVELQEEIKLALTPAAVVDIAKKQGFDVSVGDVLRKQAEAIADLSDSELENISGGAAADAGAIFLLRAVFGFMGLTVPAAVTAEFLKKKESE